MDAESNGDDQVSKNTVKMINENKNTEIQKGLKLRLSDIVAPLKSE